MSILLIRTSTSAVLAVFPRSHSQVSDSLSSVFLFTYFSPNTASQCSFSFLLLFHSFPFLVCKESYFHSVVSY